jgi:hypothetical protein
VKLCPFFKSFLVRRKLPFFGQNCSLPFSLRSLDIPALLKSWQKHYTLLLTAIEKLEKWNTNRRFHGCMVGSLLAVTLVNKRCSGFAWSSLAFGRAVEPAGIVLVK